MLFNNIDNKKELFRISLKARKKVKLKISMKQFFSTVKRICYVEGKNGTFDVGLLLSGIELTMSFELFSFGTSFHFYLVIFCLSDANKIILITSTFNYCLFSMFIPN